MRTIATIGLSVALTIAVAMPVFAQREPALPAASDCPTDLVADLAPADAQGTTFTGTYVGDMLVGHDLAAFWSVDRVYAGGPVAENLQYITPDCRWANLTPGVRYLYSTAATDLRRTGDDAGTPTVADSVAWELGADDSVELAPFDTYRTGDYAEELRSIDSLGAALDAVAPDAGEGTAPTASQRLDSGCLGPTELPSPAAAGGTTFVGRYIDDERLPASKFGVPGRRVYWSVERVYAGGPLPEVLTLRTDGCDSATLKKGGRYLFSTSDIGHPRTQNSLAWRLKKDDRVKLKPLGGRKRDLYAKEARGLTNFDAALRGKGGRCDRSLLQE